MALIKMPSWFWVGVYAAQNAIAALIGLKTSGVLAKKGGTPAEDFQNGKDRKAGER